MGDATTALTGDSASAPGGAGAGGGAGASASGASFTLPEGMSSDGDLARLIASFTRLTNAYERSFPFSHGVLEDDLETVPQDTLFDLVDVASAVNRQLSAMLAVIAQELAHRCRDELLSERLDFQYGYRSTPQFIADCLQIERRDAHALTKVGKAIIGERSLSGERLPAKAEIVADAVRGGDLGFAHAHEIVRTTEKLRKNPKVDPDEIHESEQLLVDIACDGLPLPEFRSAIAHLEGYVNPDGVAPTLEAQRQQRGLTFRTMSETGMFHVNGKFDAADGAYIRHALEAVVTGTLRACRGHNHPDPANPDPASPDQPATATATATAATVGVGTGAASAASAETAATASGEETPASGTTAASDAPGTGSDASSAAADASVSASASAAADAVGLESAAASGTNPAPEYLSEETPFPDASFRYDLDKDPYRRDQFAVETRTIAQIQADAFVDFAKHVIGCDLAKLPGPSTSVVVRMGLEDFLLPEALAGFASPSAHTETGPDATLDAGATSDIKATGDTDEVAPETAAEPTGQASHRPTSSWPIDTGPARPDPAAAFRPQPPSTCTTSSPAQTGYPARVHTRIATIDGNCGGTIIDVGTARMLAAGAGVIPIVLSYDSIVLDMEREVRLFTRQQRQALVERDGGCAFCGLPPGMTEAHHIAYWNAHEGRPISITGSCCAPRVTGGCTRAGKSGSCTTPRPPRTLR
ncbi:HNH endonuclease signature motif containing protein [Gulosibacter chungangensis]|uniref:HNH endonuclease signature motif containing protein n=1 Tax=Gulosibacter chungangensis TaxID=979746 RepID=UPI001CE40778|nr:hypothetical protein [Gulosibacter chungangensis]